MGIVEETEALKQEITKEQLRLSRLAWSIEQGLHNYRLSAIGSSGIQHRVMGSVAEVEVELRNTISEVRSQWRAA
jgi:hypothetical protein